MPSRPTVALVRPAALTTALKPSTVAAPALGVAYLAAALREAGHAVVVVDALGEAPGEVAPLDGLPGVRIGLDPEATAARVPRNADIVGVSCMFTSGWPFDRRVIEAIRRRLPDATIVAGGEHATACTEFILQTCPEVDVVARGEGEETLCALVRALRTGAGLGDVAGIALRDGERVVMTPARARIRGIDAIARPAWDLMPTGAYLDRGLNHGASRGRSMPLLATRGCPYRCSFCSSPQMWGTRWEPRDPAALVDEMVDVIATWQVQNFDLYDLTTVVKRAWIVAFAEELIRRGVRTTYQLASGTRAEAIDDEVAALLARSGCTNLTFAPESGSAGAIARHHKKVDLERMDRAIRAATRHGIVVSLNFILFPDDTWADIAATARYALHCARLGVFDMTWFPYLPYPGTELYGQLRREGRLPPMSDAFCAALLSQFDLIGSRSYNPRVGRAAVQALRLGVVAAFMTTSWARSPGRLVQNLRNVARDTPRTRAEKTLSDLLRRLPDIAAARLR